MSLGLPQFAADLQATRCAKQLHWDMHLEDLENILITSPTVMLLLGVLLLALYYNGRDGKQGRLENKWPPPDMAFVTLAKWIQMGSCQFYTGHFQDKAQECSPCISHHVVHPIAAVPHRRRWFRGWAGDAWEFLDDFEWTWSLWSFLQVASLIATYTYLSPACLAVSPVFSGLQQKSSWNCGSVAAKLDQSQTNGTQQAGGDMCTCIYIYTCVWFILSFFLYALNKWTNTFAYI